MPNKFQVENKTKRRMQAKDIDDTLWFSIIICFVWFAYIILLKMKNVFKTKYVRDVAQCEQEWPCKLMFAKICEPR